MRTWNLKGQHADPGGVDLHRPPPTWAALFDPGQDHASCTGGVPRSLADVAKPTESSRLLQPANHCGCWVKARVNLLHTWRKCFLRRVGSHSDPGIYMGRRKLGEAQLWVDIKMHKAHVSAGDITRSDCGPGSTSCVGSCEAVRSNGITWWGQNQWQGF